MASSEQVKIILVSEDNASASIKDATQAIKDLGAESKKITKGSKKDWSGLGDLFGKVLPRNLQSLMRGFKGTQRQVGRLAKGFKALKAAWASIGIGLILIALEELISNWDTVSDAIMGVTAEQKRQEKVTKAVYEAQLDLNTSVQGYIENIAQGNLKDEERAIAIEKVNSQLGHYITLNGTAEEQAKEAQILLDANLVLVEKNTKAEQERLKIKEEGEKTQKTELKWWEKLASFHMGMSEEDSLNMQRTEAQENYNDAKEVEVGLTKEELVARAKLKTLLDENIKRKAEAAEADKKSSEAAREAEAANKRAAQQALADEKFLADQRLSFAEAARVRAKEGEEAQAIEELKIQAEKDAKAIAAAKGTKTDMLEVFDQFERDKAEIVASFKADQDAKDAEDTAKADAKAKELLEHFQTDQQNELDAVQLHYEKLRELAVEDGDYWLQLIEEQKEAESKVNTKYENKKQDDDQKTFDLKLAGANKMANSMSSLMGSLMDMAEEGSEQQKRLAIADVLLNQAMAMANAVAGAAKAAKDTGPAAAFTFAAYVISMVGTVVGTFASIKKIMSEANAPSGNVGGGRPSAGASPMSMSGQVPLPARLDSPDAMQAYVVQSQLDGQMQSQQNLEGQIVL